MTRIALNVFFKISFSCQKYTNLFWKFAENRLSNVSHVVLLNLVCFGKTFLSAVLLCCLRHIQFYDVLLGFWHCNSYHIV